VFVSLAVCLVVLAGANYVYNRAGTAPVSSTKSPSPTIEATLSPTLTPIPTPGAPGGSAQGYDYFEAYRDNRKSVREIEQKYVKTVSEGENVSEEIRDEAQRELLKITQTMEKELLIEGLIIAKHFEDAVVFISDDSVTAVIKAQSLKDKDVTKILKIITDNTDVSPENVSIISRES